MRVVARHRAAEAGAEIVDAPRPVPERPAGIREDPPAAEVGEPVGETPGALPIARPSRAPSVASWRTSSAFSRTTISAAADGVGARRSATKSAIVTSVSWPTAEITGIFDATIARATASSLNAQRSSSDPPPRASTITSRSPRRLSVPSASAISPAAASPWTRTGHTRTWRPAKRRVTTRRKSRTAAPVGDVTRPTRRGSVGSARFRAGSKRPSAASRAFSCSKASWSAPRPFGSITSQTSWYSPRTA